MLNTHDENRRLELRDANGTVVEVFLPEQAVRELYEERNSLHEKLLALQEELRGLRQERDALGRERDIYLNSLHITHREKVKRMTEEELADLKANGVSEESFRQEIDRLFPSQETGGCMASGEA